MLTKERIIETIQNMPDNFSVDDILERIIFVAKVEKALAESEKGNVITTEEAKQKLAKWL